MEFLNSVHQGGLFVFILVCLLMPINWLIESYKWKMLIAPLEKLTLMNSFKAVLCGIAVSTVTPNRAGEFAGRVFFLKQADKIKATYLTFVGSGLQAFVTLFTASISFLIFIFNGLDTLHDPDEKYDGLVRVTAVLALLIFILSILFILLIPFLLKGVQHSKRKWVMALDALNQMNRSEILKLFLLSLLRYFVFFFQFYLLLILFKTNVSFKDALILIPLTFFAITIVPTVAFTEIGLRGATALLLFDAVTENSIGVVSASITLWFVNVAVPALAGCFFVFKLKFFGNE